MDPQIFAKAGMYFGLTGAFLVATRTKYSGWGFVAYLLSNLAWIPYGLHNDISEISNQHIGFIACSLLGIYCSRKDFKRAKAADGEQT